MYKHAALSPAIQALEQTPTAETQKQVFEQQLGNTAYQTYAAKFPDLVENIITYKTLDSDPDAGTAFGAFILDVGGDSAYVPVVFADSQISPIEIMYLKSKDMFVPFTQAWVGEAMRNAERALGGPAKLPDTVPTDVDIRNLVVPPTTGRYSYASTGAYKHVAQSLEPMGRMLTKRANEQFDPQMWEGFVEQFSRMNGVSPGVALDQGQMGLDELSKLYKGHAKTWAQPQAPAPQQPQSMPNEAAGAMPPAGQQPTEMYPKTAGLFQTLGGHADVLGEKAIEGAALGGLLGGATSIYDNDYSDVGNRMTRGAVGGAALGTAGHMIGSGLNKRHMKMTKGLADEAGQLIGTVAGSVGAARPDSMSMGQQDPYASYRYAAAKDDGGVAMLKHAQAAPKKREPKLLPYLAAAPNRVKVAFEILLKRDPKFLKFAAETYGAEPLLAALRKHPENTKTASIGMETMPGLRMAFDNAGTKAFGERSPMAFRGVQMRGYYYEDPKPAKNLAVLQQEYHGVHDIREPGVFNLWKVDGERVPVLALVNPVDILDEDRNFFPRNNEGLTRVRRYAPGTYEIHPEPTATECLQHPEPDVERSHLAARLLIHGDGKYSCTREMHGEQVTEEALEGTKVWKHLFTDAPSPPKAGLGIFIYKTGAHYYGTKPVKLSNISKSSDGVVTAKATDLDGDCEKQIRMDPRSPISRLMRPRGEAFALIPSTWRWMPLTSEYDKGDILMSASAIIDFGLKGLSSMGSHEANVVDAGGDMASVDSKAQMPKAAALKYLADTHDISGADAEAMLKIAREEGKCRAWVVPKAGIFQMAKFASPVEQAFGEVLQELGASLENIQGQMQVLQTVQQRAQQLSQDPNQMQATDPAMQQGAPPASQPAMDPSMQQGTPQGAPTGMDPSMQQGAPQGAPPAPPQGMDPSMPQGVPQPGMDPSMDPSMQQQPEQPPLPMMNTEGPSSAEIAQQVNPEFLQQAMGLQEQGVFDTSVLSALDHAAGSPGGANPSPLGENSKDLAETVDDLGRTLLMMQLRQVDLQEQLSNDTYNELEDQVRTTFQSLGKLMIELNQHAAALTHVQDETAT